MTPSDPHITLVRLPLSDVFGRQLAGTSIELIFRVQVAKEIWICDKKKVSQWQRDIRDYKKHLIRNMRTNMKA